MSACRREGEDTGSGQGVAGPWARSGCGLEWFPGSSFIFFLFFLFFFSVFLISFNSKVLNSQQGFKSIGSKFSRSKQDF
jgi:hypothetical protein